MRKVSITAVLLLLALAGHAQAPTVFIIDTVITYSDGFPVLPMRPGDEHAMAMPWDTTDMVTTYSEHWNEQPNVLIHLPAGANGIRLPLDDDGGELAIMWATSYTHDTIRIPRFEVFHRCFRDTIINRVEYYTVTDSGAVFKEIRTKRSRGPRPKCRKKRDRFSLVINHVRYQVPLSTMPSPDYPITVYHGYDPIGCKEARSSERDKPCLYFRGMETWAVWCYHAELLLD